VNLKDTFVALVLSFLICISSIISFAFIYDLIRCEEGLGLVRLLLIILIPLIFAVILFFALKKFTNISKIFRAVLVIFVFLFALALFFFSLTSVVDGCGFRAPEINESAVSAVKFRINLIASPGFVDATFSDGAVLDAKTIADESNVLYEGGICVGVSGDTSNYEGFLVDGQRISGSAAGEVINYIGPFSQSARLFVMCDQQNELQNSIDAYSFDFDLPPVADCGFEASDEKVCIVVVVPEE